jgi:hypothetical protein
LKDFALPLVGPVLSVVAWYLAGSAKITKPLWSRYPPWLDAWALCPACSGTWYGFASAALLGLAGWSFFGIVGPLAWVLGALWSTFFTPILARRMYEDLIALAPGERPKETPDAQK